MLARGWNKGIYKNERFMIGEITCAINRVEEQIEQLFDEKEEFIILMKMRYQNYVSEEVD